MKIFQPLEEKSAAPISPHYWRVGTSGAEGMIRWIGLAPAGDHAWQESVRLPHEMCCPASLDILPFEFKTMKTQRSRSTYTHSAHCRYGSAALACALSSSICAQAPFSSPGTGQPPAPPAPKATPAAPETATLPAPEPGAVERFFNGKLPGAIVKGKFSVNVRLRYEYADQDGLAAIAEASHAPTLRTRFGYTTAPLHGFQGMLEGENTAVIGPEEDFNAAGSNGVGDRPVVADPETTELNQAWLSYTYTNLFTIKGGRQRLVLDNHRFIGDVGWRQNMQTFNAATIQSKPVDDVTFFYGYVWDVRRVFGDVGGLGAALTNFKSDSHILNASYSGWDYGRFSAYSYLLNLENAAGFGQSSATYGGYFAGAAPINETLSIGYRAELAWQTDYADSPLDYEAEYYNLELGATVKPFAFGAGYEAFGSDNGTSFRTPLATLHAFNGWADAFLNTPAAGLRDLYAYAQVTLPWQVPLRFVYHKFDAETGGGDFGQEFDLVVSKKFGKHWSALLKYAYYDGEDPAPPAMGAPYDAHKFWAQVEFNF